MNYLRLVLLRRADGTWYGAAQGVGTNSGREGFPTRLAAWEWAFAEAVERLTEAQRERDFAGADVPERLQ